MQMVTISSNHGHDLKIPPADITAASDKMYSIKGTSQHDHMVTVTAAMFTKLNQGMMIMMTSTNVSNHDHVVTVKCA